MQIAPVESRRTHDELADELRRVELRLEDGFRKIERAIDEGDEKQRIARWEDLWINLLKEYEQLHERIAA